MRIRNISIITKREISTYINSPAAYVFVIIFLMLSGFFTFMISAFFEGGEANLGAFFQWHPWLFLFLVPAIGMHLWSDERRLGTIELLFTMPVTTAECIIAKFLAAWAFIGVALVLTFPMVVTVGHLGHPDYGAIACGYLGSLLLGGAYLAIAAMTSALSKSQVVSFILALVICFLLVAAGWTPVTDMLADWAPRQLIDAVGACGVMPHYISMQRGVIDTRDLVYYASVMGLALFLTGITLKSHRAG